jgi:hypothetical protein
LVSMSCFMNSLFLVFLRNKTNSQQNFFPNRLLLSKKENHLQITRKKRKKIRRKDFMLVIRRHQTEQFLLLS